MQVLLRRSQGAMQVLLQRSQGAMQVLLRRSKMFIAFTIKCLRAPEERHVRSPDG
jgi:hypothetical protein